MKKIRIGDRIIGDGEPLYFIADIGANHDRELKRAFKLIELAKETGADAAKFQNFQASKIVSKYGFESLGKQLSHQSSWSKPVFDVYKDASLPFDWIEKIKAKCSEVGIEYLTSPYDFESVDLVDPYINVYKIGSGDITWLEIIEYIARKGKPIIISTGASTMKDVVRAMNVLESLSGDIVLMQCNTNYTASRKNFNYINLNVLKTYKKRFPCTILGLSDHTYGHSTVLGAIALGARVFEKHFTDDNDREGPDHKFAMNPRNWKEMVALANEMYNSLGNEVKDIEENEKETAVLQRRALRFTRNLLKGHVLSKSDLFPLRPIPSDGIPPYAINDFVGRKLKRNVKMDDYLRKGDVEL